MLSTDSDGVLVAIRVKPRVPAAKIAWERGIEGMAGADVARAPAIREAPR
jgi:hypothetical protein